MTDSFYELSSPLVSQIYLFVEISGCYVYWAHHEIQSVFVCSPNLIGFSSEQSWNFDCMGKMT